MTPVPIVLVHGAFHGPWCFDPVRPLLQARGIPTVAPELPLGTLDDDIAAVRAALDAVGGPSVLLGHSFGGAVVTGAAAGRDDVLALVYLAAAMPDAGETVGAAMGDMADSPIVSAIVVGPDGRTSVDPARARELFYPDAPVADGARWAARLRSGDPRGTTGTVAGAAWRERPTWYVVCADDPIVPAAMQRRLATRAGATVVELAGDHSPFLARPAELADLLAAVHAEVTADGAPPGR